jgi:lysozyme
VAINVVVDLSHHNNLVDLQKAKEGGIIGIFHKATQGQSFADPLYSQHQSSARNAGLLWGAYHFGDGSDGISQAEYFLKAVGDPSGMLLVLDFESNPTGPSMSIEEARAFVTHVKAATGVWPGFYCGHYFKETLGSAIDPVISNCWLWLAQYGPTAVVPPTWSTWKFWQYTDGANGPGPHDAPGIGLCDRDQFNGSLDDLRALWS